MTLANFLIGWLVAAVVVGFLVAILVKIEKKRDNIQDGE